MKINKKVIESAAVGVFALAMMVTAGITGNVDTKAEQYTGSVITEETKVQTATKEKAVVDIVAAADEQPAQDVTAEAVVAEPVAAEAAVVEEAPEAEVSEWATKLMPTVEESLNIRAEASEEAEVVGKLYKGAVADIIERGEAWTKITSGSVTGWVKNEYCAFDADAEALAKEQGTVYATALTTGLRVRAEANMAEDAVLLDVLEEGKKIKVDTAVTAPEGWVAVLCSGTTGYVSAEYVTVELELGKAISIEEELAAIRKAEEEKAAKAAAQRQSSATTQREAVAASYDDTTLLAALIQCEAGGECYEGQVAVGAVVMNRLRNGYAGSISGVIYQSGQFTPASSGALSRALANGVSGSCYQAAQAALSGVDNVGGATSFRRASSGYSGIVIGNHVFF